jgi:predicted nucleotidyltransferase
MRFHSPLTHILDNRTKVIVLRLLCKYPTSITGRQLAKIVKVNHTTVNEALNGLINEQVILVRKVGKSHIYELNKTNWIVTKLLIPIFKQEDVLLDDFIKHVSQAIKRSPISKRIVSLGLFGSVYECREKPTSDIDLFIVVAEAKYKKIVEDLIFEIDSNLISLIGMGIEPYIKTIAELKKDRELNVIKSILKSHRIIWGKSLEKVL